jgi:hypothetical protein
MPDLPNIKAEILVYMIEEGTAEDPVVNLREFASEKGYEEHRVAKKSNELYPLVECGVSPMVPWIQHGRRDDVREKIDEWGYEVDD